MLGFAERRVCRVLGQPRSTQRYQRQPPDDEAPLTAAIIKLASQYGRYGYRQVTGLLRNEGWRVNHKRVERIWRREGLKVPKKQPPRRRLWLTDGSCIRLRAEHPNHVWAYDFMATRTEDGRPVKLLTIVDEYTRECLAIDVERRLRSDDVLYRLAELFVQRGVPEHIRSDNGICGHRGPIVAQPGRCADALHHPR
jgi:transposase InsO family protein